ncbi:hypothetical protein C8F04DRAFT_1086893 [Mycena alexandri]|uniref:Uncharacterized protein n=1 Tax=Mycena alexandri TaxID=1745969 RepID=A0AAD6X880_9AGAR|nr:hypothetical protein C8F04DRAFT_1086893 [Mycena alexandri]
MYRVAEGYATLNAGSHQLQVQLGELGAQVEKRRRQARLRPIYIAPFSTAVCTVGEGRVGACVWWRGEGRLDSVSLMMWCGLYMSRSAVMLHGRRNIRRRRMYLLGLL